MSVSKSPHQNSISQSAERNTFQRDAYIERCRKDGKEPDPEMIAMYDAHKDDADKQQHDPEWQKDNLEYDLLSTSWVLEKARGDRVYAQHIYAALCNTEWQRTEVWPILKNERWSCSWRHAGGIIADMVEEGDYIDWYCSGIRGEGPDEEWLAKATEEQLIDLKNGQAHVGEGCVTDEVRADFLKLGWQQFDSGDDDQI